MGQVVGRRQKVLTQRGWGSQDPSIPCFGLSPCKTKNFKRQTKKAAKSNQNHI